MKTYSPKASEIQRQRHIIDASNQVLGRMATQVAKLLMGKHKPSYARNIDSGDYVVVVNAARVRVTGKKLEGKIYYRHSGYPGGLKQTVLGEVMATRPERVVEMAVVGMLPKTRLGRAMRKKLTVYAREPVNPQAREKRVKKEGE
ncbi:MAG: 50S ribosomal protein L13 [Dehalococcoidia bacterium]|jgi:large subunit ribosomal protein L13|nr:50S ribosomal protein L13 [Dehalococcoidia bacterium]MDP7469323.1 50S ribosomal protein L13 [Dehalococcoidia bacterium]